MEQTPYRAVFFDLDGTLLPMDLKEFMQAYFESLAAYVAKRGIDHEQFIAGLKLGIKAMAAPDDDRLNTDKYWEAFFGVVERSSVDWESLMLEFYEHDFGKIGESVVPEPAAIRAVTTLAEKGYPLVLATMPMFPLRAVQWRLSWAGIDPALFSRITHFENSTAVKPSCAYYAENLDAVGLEGSEVLMVGNNTLEDLACIALDVDAYLVTDHVLDPVKFDMSTVKNGSMEEFARWVETLPICADPATAIEVGPIARRA